VRQRFVEVMDRDATGEVTLNEFLEVFRLVDNNTSK
jgi:hypothetical protein